MRKRRLFNFMMFIALLFMASFLPLSQSAKSARDDLQGRATDILVGKVKAMDSKWNDENTLIYTLVTVKVEKVLKGPIKDDEVLISHLGGEVGDIGQFIEYEPRFKKGEKVKLYLKRETNGVYTVINGAKGKQSLKAEEVTLPGYYWEGHRWLSLPVHYYVNLNGAPSAALSAVQASFQVWEDDPGSYIDYTYAGATILSSIAKDDNNIVFWGYYDGSGGVLAVCTFWYHIPTLEILEFDIQFDSGDDWQIWENTADPNAFDVMNVGTHEAGHSLGLLDLYSSADSSETMYGYSSPGQTTKRTLYTGDLMGLHQAYPETYILGASVKTDKAVYKEGWDVQVSHRITSKYIESKNVIFWWAIYFGKYYTISYVPDVTLPKMFEIVLDVDLTIPNLGGSAFSAYWVIAIIDPSTGDILSWDYCQWTYNPSAPSTSPFVTLDELANQLAKSNSQQP